MTFQFHGLECLSLADQVLFNKFGRGQNVPTPDKAIHEAFEDVVDRQPEEIAVEYDGRELTYGELDRAANGLANRLISLGLEPRQRVCLVVQRSLPMVIAIFAILKAGSQYVPLDGQVTAESALRHVMKDTQAPFVLCLEKFHAKVTQLAEPGTEIVVLDDGLYEPQSVSRPKLCVSPSDGIYAIYTSGSTGSPKGVDLCHGNVANLLLNSPGNLGIQRDTRVAQLLSISFDMAQWEILGTLVNGGTLLIRTSDWKDVLRRVNTVICTPSILATFPRHEYPNIKVVALAAEPCPKDLADDWSKQATFYNNCGPTEVTIVNTMHRHTLGEELSIGKPIPNTNVYILDEAENPVAIGQTGVMWVGGRAVSRGYLNLPDLTAKKYKSDKFANDGSFMFNTGDLCRWRTDGTIAHQGRADDQVKIKGCRVELDSISASMEAALHVTKACAIFSENVLWGFYTGAQEMEEATIKACVGERQPYYAVPTRFVFRETLPMTSNGKIDKRALLASVGANVLVTPPASLIIQEPAPTFIMSEKKGMEVVVTDSQTSSAGTSTYDLDLQKFEVPEKKGRHVLRSIRHRVFSLYRKLFSIVFIVNAVAMILMYKFSRAGHGLANASTAVAANLLMAVLMRQEYVINAMYAVLTSVPVSWPFWIRRYCANMYHIGGIHSGCAVSSLVWLLIFTIGSTINRPEAATLTVSYLIIALMAGIVVTAQPAMRIKYHDHFEMMHRFAGWTVVALFWAQTCVVTNSFRGTVSLGNALVKSPGMWLLATATFSIIVPWLHLRKVVVRAEVLSPNAARLYFTYTGNPIVGSAIRISERPLLEWHAFASIAKPGEKEFSIIVANAGDWTSRQIQKGPTKMWVRGIPTSGVIGITPLFRSVVLVATGSGIGPCLPVIYAKKVPCRIFWSTPNPEQMFGSEIINSVRENDPDAVIHNTRTMGRPDMVAITYRLFVESGAEAVVIISNQKLTQLVVYGMESRGIPAYGAIFDS